MYKKCILCVQILYIVGEILYINCTKIVCGNGCGVPIGARHLYAFFRHRSRFRVHKKAWTAVQA